MYTIIDMYIMKNLNYNNINYEKNAVLLLKHEKDVTSS